MKVLDFDFFLPPYLIAERPLQERDRSRLLVLHRDGLVEHKCFSDLSTYLNKGDLILMNNTKVFPARLTGVKKSGESIDILLVREKEENDEDFKWFMEASENQDISNFIFRKSCFNWCDYKITG